MIVISIMAMIIFTGCSTKEETIVFTAVIDEINDNSLLVTTIDFDGFDRASVGYGEDLEIGFNLIVGQKLSITILPEIRESYPVQVTAVGIELLEDVQNMDLSYRKITSKKAKEMIDGGDVVILDVRTESEFAEAHIAGAILLPDYDIEALSPEVLTDKSETILVYCRSGRRSEVAAKALIEMGYTNVYDFGGIIDWPYETVSGK